MARYAFLSLALVSLVLSSGFGKSDAFDLVISGAHVIDGSGNPWYVADVAIRDGIIVEIGDLSRGTSTRVIDAHETGVLYGALLDYNVRRTAVEGICAPIEWKFPGTTGNRTGWFALKAAKR